MLLDLIVLHFLNSRLKFKQLFETVTGRKQGVFVNFPEPGGQARGAQTAAPTLTRALRD
jgi:hypothetical protein